MALDDKTQEEITELEIKFPSLFTVEETTDLIDYFTRDEFIGQYTVLETVTVGKFQLEFIKGNQKRKWIRGTRPEGIYGFIQPIDNNNLSVLFDCGLASTDEGIRYRNITFGLPSEQTVETDIREAEKIIISKVKSLANDYFRKKAEERLRKEDKYDIA